MQGTNRSEEGGEEPARMWPRNWVTTTLIGGGEERRTQIINGIWKKTEKKKGRGTRWYGMYKVQAGSSKKTPAFVLATNECRMQ